MAKPDRLSVTEEAGLFANEGSIGGPYGAAGGAIVGGLDAAGLHPYNWISGGGKGSLYRDTHKAPDVPKEPTWTDIDPEAMRKLGIKADQEEYARDDAAFCKLYPDLCAARDFSVKDASAQLGGTNQAVVNALNQAGFSGEAGRFAGTGGKQDVQRQSLQLGLPVAALEERNRNYFTRLLGENKPRPFGPNGQDALEFAVSNAKQQQINADALFQSRTELYNAAQTNANANTAGLGSAIGSGFSQAIKDYYSTINARDPGLPSNYTDLGAPT